MLQTTWVELKEAELNEAKYSREKNSMEKTLREQSSMGATTNEAERGGVEF